MLRNPLKVSPREPFIPTPSHYSRFLGECGAFLLQQPSTVHSPPFFVGNFCYGIADWAGFAVGVCCMEQLFSSLQFIFSVFC